jgi:hypothetical protein
MKYIKLCSGFGVTHSSSNKPLSTMIWDEITALIDYPQDIEKSKSQWVIPSTLASRRCNDQEEAGQYWMLWADIDHAPPSVSELAKSVEGIVEGCRFEVYTTKSATEYNHKSRILIPLGKKLSPQQWLLCQEILNDQLELGLINPDRSSEKLAQLLFLPDRGEHYESQSNRVGPYFDPLEAFSSQLAIMQEAIKAKELAIAETIHNAMLKRSERLAQGFKSPIAAFNVAYLVEEILIQSGYDQRGDLFRHPNSESGSFSASVKGQRVHTLSTVDPLYTDGGGVGAHDAFSVFTVLWHNDDRDAAIKDACNNWLSGWNEENEMEGDLGHCDLVASPANSGQDQALVEMPVPRYDLRPPVVKTPFKLTAVGELLKQPPTLKWLIKGYLPPEGLGFINGDPATGKSLLALDWFCHIACAIPWRGNPVKQGGVVVIAGEGHFGLRRRLKAWGIVNDVDLSDKPIVVSDIGASLTDKQSVEAVTEAIEGFVEEHGQLSLIIIDTLHRNLGAADENSSEDMAVYFNNLDALRAKYECLIMTVHHSGHGDKSRARGSSSIRAAIDIEYQISKSNDVSEVSCQKMKDAAKPKKFAFELKEVDLPWLHDTGENEVSVVIVEAETSSGQGKKLTAQHLVVFEALCRLSAEADTGEGDKIKIGNNAWRDQAFIKMTHDNQDSKRKAFNRAKSSLIELGYVDVENDEYWIEVLSLSPQTIGEYHKISGELSANAIMGLGQTGH